MDNNVNNLRLVNGSHVIVKHTAVEILAYNIVSRIERTSSDEEVLRIALFLLCLLVDVNPVDLDLIEAVHS